MPNLTRVREIYEWLEMLKSKKGKLWTGAKLFKKMRQHFGVAFLETSIGRIVDLIGREFFGEAGDTEILCEDIVDFFYDALFEQKRRGFSGSGVILSTAHKVKGLEFDNVILLDGSWSEGSRSIDEFEEARRLYYVAITRARKSLTLLKLNTSTNRFIAEIPASITCSREVQPQICDSRLLDYRYEVIDLGDVYISYAAYFKPFNQNACALKRTQMNDAVNLTSKASADGTQNIFISNKYNVELARLSKQGVAKWMPRLSHVSQARVSCLHTRHRDDGNGDNPRANETWLIPVVEVLWKSS